MSRISYQNSELPPSGLSSTDITRKAVFLPRSKMANKRMINGDTFEDEFFTTLSIFDRLLWIGCITKLADDQGRFRDNAALIRSNLFPMDDIPLNNIEKAIQLFSIDGRILRYEKDGKKLIQIVNWWKHQKPRWASASNYPAPGGWTDRFRYHGAENVIIEKNWKTNGGYIADSIADSILCEDEDEDEDEDEVKDEVKDDNENKDEDENSPIHLLFGAFVTGIKHEPYSNERDSWIKQLSELASEGIQPEDITQAFIELEGRYSITSPKSIKAAAITCKKKRLNPKPVNKKNKLISDMVIDNLGDNDGK